VETMRRTKKRSEEASVKGICVQIKETKITYILLSRTLHPVNYPELTNHD
jgi:hypothetical protein